MWRPTYRGPWREFPRSRRLPAAPGGHPQTVRLAGNGPGSSPPIRRTRFVVRRVLVQLSCHLTRAEIQRDMQRNNTIESIGLILRTVNDNLDSMTELLNLHQSRGSQCSDLDAIDNGDRVGWSPCRTPHTIQLTVAIKVAPNGSGLSTNRFSASNPGRANRTNSGKLFRIATSSSRQDLGLSISQLIREPARPGHIRSCGHE